MQYLLFSGENSTDRIEQCKIPDSYILWNTPIFVFLDCGGKTS